MDLDRRGIAIHPGPMTKQTPKRTPQEQIRHLAEPMLEARAPKDHNDVVEIFRLALEHGIYKDDLPEITGLSPKTIHQFANARTSSARPWLPLRKALQEAGISIPVPLKLSPGAEARVGHFGGNRGKVGRATVRSRPVEDAVPPTVSVPEAPLISAPTPPAPQPTLTTTNQPLVEIRPDLTIVLRPGHPEHAITLQRLIVNQGVRIVAA